MTTNVRALAALVLTPLLQNKGSLNTQYPSIERSCPEKDRALLRELCYGTMRHHPQLNCIIKLLQNRAFKFRDIDIKAIVLVGIYQLQHTRIPPHAAISESVDACRELDKEWAGKVVNAILRRFQREQEELEESLSSNESYRYNHPEWMIAKLKNNWPDHWQQILESNNSQAPLTLRINQQQTERPRYLEQLEPIVDSEETLYSDLGIRLSTSLNVESLPGYEQGSFSVQDEAAQFAAQLLDLKPQQYVLDACAAPGGKLCHILETEPSLKAVDAVELEERRAGRIEENLDRLNLDANLIIADASTQEWWSGELYDRILLDAPCSATGVIRRNPDIKYLRQGEDIIEISKLQLSILENCWSMLKPGGKILYATCSIFPQENERLIKRFMAKADDAVHRPIDAEWGIKREYGRQLFPQVSGHDGFYYALLQKQSKLD
ncbi:MULTISPECIES: 16S rRNA (cytosine(967)-C(5))-methyltransferase RsmB [unclassified Neptuniibacter]|uniref:16S rRNA (cytosine(967)-C(5))-methyltransferase RsmB n=1 Tax=unclassified Neptuniibacter TaxID=2630693 RepID=UPI000C3BEF57|nr:MULTISPECIES: 16S rRNA (cytosine(967)-C(5))-methyltransferase RsmB [unclassified Neptuniibacter]MAY42670.1 16S rRNA (cytosine(967)-C(5))-methyltransferase [Oceanospirillaceae bacterium]|tara:strand:+ start:35231 stop:36538 length:1308 start_codon:yes stop_codon:yes gene_type:complete